MKLEDYFTEFNRGVPHEGPCWTPCQTCFVLVLSNALDHEAVQHERYKELMEDTAMRLDAELDGLMDLLKAVGRQVCAKPAGDTDCGSCAPCKINLLVKRSRAPKECKAQHPINEKTLCVLGVGHTGYHAAPNTAWPPQVQ
jgi:hypothetical protein